MSITENLINIKDNLPKNVTLVAVSKFHPAHSIAIAYGVGQRVFGESRVQELVAKYNDLPKDIRWHMIGHLQTNKVRSIVPFISLIESVDSEHLLEVINQEAERVGRVINCLLEVHVASEQSKTGWNIDYLKEYIKSGKIAKLHNIHISGIMGMASNTDDVNIIKNDFTTLSNIKKELEPYFDSSFSILSMGMSHDYHIAIECGSNMIRVGTSIFGER